MEKPAAWRMVLGSIFPLYDVCAWEVREELLDKLARDLEQAPGAKLIADLQEIAGRDWPRLYEELRARWAST